MSWQQIANSCSRGRWLTDEEWINWNHIWQEIKILLCDESGMGGSTAGNPQEGACQKLHLCCTTFCGVQRPWDLTIFFPSHFLFKVSKTTRELWHNPLEFSVMYLCTTGCVLWALCASWGLCPEITGITKVLATTCAEGHDLGASCRQLVSCCGQVQKALFSHARLTTESVYFECCHRGMLHLSNLILTSLCRTCSSAKTYHGILTCTRAN